MSIVKEVENTKGYFIFKCEGCKCAHYINTNPEYGITWSFNGNLDKPTVNPSLLVRWSDINGNHVCHSFIKNGEIEYLNDSTHFLKGKTVSMIDFK